MDALMRWGLLQGLGLALNTPPTPNVTYVRMSCEESGILVAARGVGLMKVWGV